MDNWKELKHIAGNLFKNLDYEQAAEKYIETLQNLEKNSPNWKMVIHIQMTRLV